MSKVETNVMGWQRGVTSEQDSLGDIILNINKI